MQSSFVNPDVNAASEGPSVVYLAKAPIVYAILIAWAIISVVSGLVWWLIVSLK